MKTSSILATLAVVTGFTTITITNLKLKSEYDKGNLKDPYVRKAVSSFRFVKETADTSVLRKGGFTIMAGMGDSTSVASYYADREQFLFEVRNDTLYISSDPAYGDIFSHGSPIIIRTPKLSGLEANTGDFSIEAGTLDSLSVRVSRKSSVGIDARKINSLFVHATNTASVDSRVADTVRQLDLRLDDQSRFAAHDMVAAQKKLQISNNSHVQLSGRSVGNFGLK